MAVVIVISGDGECGLMGVFGNTVNVFQEFGPTTTSTITTWTHHHYSPPPSPCIKKMFKLPKFIFTFLYTSLSDLSRIILLLTELDARFLILALAIMDGSK